MTAALTAALTGTLTGTLADALTSALGLPVPGPPGTGPPGPVWTDPAVDPFTLRWFVRLVSPDRPTVC